MAAATARPLPHFPQPSASSSYSQRKAPRRAAAAVKKPPPISNAAIQTVEATLESDPLHQHALRVLLYDARLSALSCRASNDRAIQDLIPYLDNISVQDVCARIEEDRARDTLATPSVPAHNVATEMRTFRAAKRAYKVERHIAQYLNEVRESVDASTSSFQNIHQRNMPPGIRAVIQASQTHRTFHLQAVERALVTWPHAPPGTSDIPFSVIAHVDTLKARMRQFKDQQRNEQRTSSGSSSISNTGASEQRNKRPLSVKGPRARSTAIHQIGMTKNYRGSPPGMHPLGIQTSDQLRQKRPLRTGSAAIPGVSFGGQTESMYNDYSGPPAGYGPDHVGDDGIDESEEDDDDIYKDERSGIRGRQYVYDDRAEEDEEDDLYAVRQKLPQRAASFYGQQQHHEQQSTRISGSTPILRRTTSLRNQASAAVYQSRSTSQQFTQSVRYQHANEFEDELDDELDAVNVTEEDPNIFDPPPPVTQSLPRNGSTPSLHRPRNYEQPGAQFSLDGMRKAYPTNSSSQSYSVPPGVQGSASTSNGNNNGAAATNPYAAPWPPNPHYYYLPPYGHPYGQFPPMYDATPLHFPLTERLLRDTPSKLAAAAAAAKVKPSYDDDYNPGRNGMDYDDEEDEEDEGMGGYSSAPDGYYGKHHSKSFDARELRGGRGLHGHQYEEDEYDEEENRHGGRMELRPRSSRFTKQTGHGSRAMGRRGRHDHEYDDDEEDYEDGAMSDPGSTITKSASKVLQKRGKQAISKLKDLVQSEGAGEFVGAALEHGGLGRNAKRLNKYHRTVRGLAGYSDDESHESLTRSTVVGHLTGAALAKAGSVISKKRNARNGRQVESDDETSIGSRRRSRRGRGILGGMLGGESSDDDPSPGKLAKQAIQLVSGDKEARKLSAVGEMASNAFHLWHSSNKDKRDRDYRGSRGLYDDDEEDEYEDDLESRYGRSMHGGSRHGGMNSEYAMYDDRSSRHGGMSSRHGRGDRGMSSRHGGGHRGMSSRHGGGSRSKYGGGDSEMGYEEEDSEYGGGESHYGGGGSSRYGGGGHGSRFGSRNVKFGSSSRYRGRGQEEHRSSMGSRGFYPGRKRFSASGATGMRSRKKGRGLGLMGRRRGHESEYESSSEEEGGLLQTAMDMIGNSGGRGGRGGGGGGVEALSTIANVAAGMAGGRGKKGADIGDMADLAAKAIGTFAHR